MDKDKALKLALGKIKSARDCPFSAIDALLFEAEGILEQALASQPAPVQEPVESPDDWSDWKVTPPAAQRPWVGLTQDELDAMFSNTIKGKKLVKWVARAIEAKLKEKNNG